ncbi:MAG: hypothetical protein LKF31_04000 [Muribaculaceae bacterium]|jgi:hypothetical protein|nr:hypothetical protein [Muribaculaceae bacterium]
MTDKRDYPEELTDKMHSEFTISEEDRIQLKAGTIWRDFPDETEEVKRELCKDMGLSWEDCLRWKDYWMQLISSSKEGK